MATQMTLHNMLLLSCCFTCLCSSLWPLGCSGHSDAEPSAFWGTHEAKPLHPQQLTGKGGWRMPLFPGWSWQGEAVWAETKNIHGPLPHVVQVP